MTENTPQPPLNTCHAIHLDSDRIFSVSGPLVITEAELKRIQQWLQYAFIVTPLIVTPKPMAP